MRLKRCPFCGGKAAVAPTFHDGVKVFTVYCTASSSCPAMVRPNMEAAVQGWNRRAPTRLPWWGSFRAWFRRKMTARVLRELNDDADREAQGEYDRPERGRW